MRKTQISALMLFVMLAFGAFAASAWAEAIPEWLVNGSTISSGSSAEVVSETEAGSLLLLEDMKASVAGNPDILCELVEKGLLLSEGKDEAKEATCSKAVDDAHICSSAKVAALHLPWTTQLLEPTEGVFVDDITKGTGGAPGWSVECVIALIGTIHDECTTESSATLVVKNLESGKVETEFMEAVSESEQANCSLGGSKQGLSAGKILIASTEGKKIEVFDCTVEAPAAYETEEQCLDDNMKPTGDGFERLFP
jgi:hypothetical protein